MELVTQENLLIDKKLKTITTKEDFLFQKKEINELLENNKNKIEEFEKTSITKDEFEKNKKDQLELFEIQKQQIKNINIENYLSKEDFLKSQNFNNIKIKKIATEIYEKLKDITNVYKEENNEKVGLENNNTELIKGINSLVSKNDIKILEEGLPKTIEDLKSMVNYIEKLMANSIQNYKVKFNQINLNFQESFKNMEQNLITKNEQQTKKCLNKFQNLLEEDKKEKNLLIDRKYNDLKETYSKSFKEYEDKFQKEYEEKNQTLLEICSKNQKNNTLLVDQLKTDFNNQILALQNKIESDIRTSENKNKEQTSTQKISLEGSLNSSIHKSKWLVKDTVFTVLIIGLSGGLGFLGVMLFSTNKKLKKN